MDDEIPFKMVPFPGGVYLIFGAFSDDVLLAILVAFGKYFERCPTMSNHLQQIEAVHPLKLEVGFSRKKGR